MDKLKVMFTDRRMLIVFLLGFASGLPLLLTGSTLQAWCKDSGMDLTTIGLFSLVGLPYTLKFLWSPVLDWIVPPFMGRRRGWLLMTQIGLIATLIGLAMTDPKSGSSLVAVMALLVAFMSATQDIGIDAYQIEILPKEQYGLGNQLYILGYRVGMLAAGAGTLILADMMSWQMVYFVMAGTMAVGVLTTFFAREPKIEGTTPRNFKDAVWEPLKDFFSPSGSHKGKALWILAFFLLYKIGVDMAATMSTPFYMDLNFSKTDIGTMSKAVGLWATIAGGLLGGIGVVYFGIRRSLWAFGIFQGVACLSYAWLAYYVGSTGVPAAWALGVSISVENLAVGMATAAYATFMGSLVNTRFTATQYALLSSLMGMPRVFAGPFAGWTAQNLGWSAFFIFCSAAAIPGLLILLKLKGAGEAAASSNAAVKTDEANAPANDFVIQNSATTPNVTLSPQVRVIGVPYTNDNESFDDASVPFVRATGTSGASGRSDIDDRANTGTGAPTNERSSDSSL